MQPPDRRCDAARPENLVKAGVKELLVISQDTSAYGVDVKYRTGFWNGRPVKTRLLRTVQELGELGVWVRLHYVYPYPSVDDLIPLMAEGKILPYLDVPFQHASPRILKLMKRPAIVENSLERIEAWRAICPDLTIRSTFIAGFPGETEAEFDELLDFLDEAAARPRRLLRLFAGRRAPGQRAARRRCRRKCARSAVRLMQHQEDISTQRLERKIGRASTVLVDEIDEEGAIARTAGRCAGDRRPGLYHRRPGSGGRRVRRCHASPTATCTTSTPLLPPLE